LKNILSRSIEYGVKKIIMTGTGSEESSQAHTMACSELSSSELPLFFTCGVHPTHCNEYKKGVSTVEMALEKTIIEGMQTGKLVAIG